MRDVQLHNTLYEVIRTHTINTLTNLITSSIRYLIKIPVLQTYSLLLQFVNIT